jgi:phosphate transport system substrate-binding protein
MTGWGDLNSAIAVAAGVVGIASAVVGLLEVRHRRRRNLVTYRVEHNSPVTLTPGRATQVSDLKITLNGAPVDDPSLVILRVRNAGTTHLAEGDFTDPLKFQFPRRSALGAQISDVSSQALNQRLPPAGPQSGSTRECGEVTLPKVNLMRRDSFKVLVVLRGAGSDVVAQGFVKEGSFEKEAGRTRLRVAIAAAGSIVFLMLSAVLVALLVVPAASGPPAYCARGNLLLEGSSGFAALAKEIAHKYEESCGGAHITVREKPSEQAVRELDRAGRESAGKELSQLAMSGGRPSQEYPSLDEYPIGVSIFAMVVNRKTGVQNLTLNQVRGIYEGLYRNWRQVGGADLSIAVVSRPADSGTRRSFEQRLLGHGETLELSTIDCKKNDQSRVPNPKVVHCERAITEDLLDTVNQVDGAIGYAAVWRATSYGNVNVVRLDGVYPDLKFVRNDVGAARSGPSARRYHFWWVEYFYTYGPPEDGSLLAAFLGYMSRDEANVILQRRGYPPCTDAGNRALCNS